MAANKVPRAEKPTAFTVTNRQTAGSKGSRSKPKKRGETGRISAWTARTNNEFARNLPRNTALGSQGQSASPARQFCWRSMRNEFCKLRIAEKVNVIQRMPAPTSWNPNPRLWKSKEKLKTIWIRSEKKKAEVKLSRVRSSCRRSFAAMVSVAE